MTGAVPETEETMINKRDMLTYHDLVGKATENKEANIKWNREYYEEIRVLKQRISGKWEDQFRFYSVKSSLSKWHLNGNLKEEEKGTQWGGEADETRF